MKRLLLIFFILTSSLYSNEIEDGIKLYKNKNYKKAYEIFLKSLEKNNYSSIKLNFYFALTAEKIGNYKEALGALERILIYQPDNVRILLERAKVYFVLENYKLSKQYFLELKPKVNKKTALIIEKYLNYIQEKTKKGKTNILSASIIIGSGYDSNINDTSTADKYDIYLGNTATSIQNSQKVESSTIVKEIFNLKYKHKFKTGILDNNFLIYSKQYSSSHKKDFTLFKYSPNYKIIKNNYLFESFLTYNYLIYNNNHYLSVYGIGENINYKHKKLLNTLSLKIDNKIYSETPLMNSSLFTINNDLKYLFTKNKISFQLGIEKNKKHKGDLANVNYINYKIGLKNSYSINKTTILDSSISFENKKYSDFYTIFNKYQNDKTTTFSLGISKKLKSFLIQTNYKYINCNSNITPFDYNKWSLELNLIKPIQGF